MLLSFNEKEIKILFLLSPQLILAHTLENFVVNRIPSTLKSRFTLNSISRSDPDQSTHSQQLRCRRDILVWVYPSFYLNSGTVAVYFRIGKIIWFGKVGATFFFKCIFSRSNSLQSQAPSIAVLCVCQVAVRGWGRGDGYCVEPRQQRGQNLADSLGQKPTWLFIYFEVSFSTVQAFCKVMPDCE